MIHTGRNRYKTHGGIPHGSIVKRMNGNNTLQLCLMWKEGVADIEEPEGVQWNDQSGQDRHAQTPEGAGKAATDVDGSLDFEAGESVALQFIEEPGEARVIAKYGFAFWIVCTLESTGANNTIFGLNNTDHNLEFKASADAVRVKLDSTLTQVNPGDGTQNDFSSGTKFLLTFERETGNTGNINLWKNGGLLAQDSQASNNGEAEFLTIGVRNGDRYFDGKIYDIVVLGSTDASTGLLDDSITRINNYLCAKHGIEIIN